jgi:hypothetical protein
MDMPKTDSTPEQSRRALGDELTGLAGLVYRIANQTLDPDGMHAAALAVVYEAIYLARQIMLTDALEAHDIDDLHDAMADLERKARHWKISTLQAQVWNALAESLKPDGPSGKAVEFALYEWLNHGELDGKSVETLAEEFTAFLEAGGKKTAKRSKK